MDSQTELHVEVTQGNDDDPKYVKVIGDELLRIPPYPAGAPVDVTFAYDIDQTVFIEVTDVTAEQSLGTFEVNKCPTWTDRKETSRRTRSAFWK